MPIYKTSKGTYKIKNVKGEHKTKASAQKQLAAVKASQASEKKKKR